MNLNLRSSNKGSYKPEQEQKEEFFCAYRSVDLPFLLFVRTADFNKIRRQMKETKTRKGYSIESELERK